MEQGMDNMKKVHGKSDGYYDRAWRWVEDTYLKYFGENRTSYAVRGEFCSPCRPSWECWHCVDTLQKGEISGNKDIDGAQRSVTDAVGGQLGKGGVGESVGTNVDKGLLRGNVWGVHFTTTPKTRLLFLKLIPEILQDSWSLFIQLILARST